MSPSLSPRLCVVIPVYNHALTVGRVIRGARAAFPVVVIDDGSTDGTAAEIAAQTAINVLTFPRNSGKGAALQAGFDRARHLGFTHAITLDADGQHSLESLGEFAALCRRRPEALLIGVRDLKKERAPWVRRVINALSTFWFRTETGIRLADTECGHRCYPLAAIEGLPVKAGRYAYELELMVKAAWAGVPLVPMAVESDYASATSRLSHFRPLRDLLGACLTHGRLSVCALWVPAPRRKLSVQEIHGG